MKPLGMNPLLQIIRPDAVQDKVWDAVEAAVDAGWTPENFMLEVRNDWSDYLSQRRKDDDRAFERATR